MVKNDIKFIGTFNYYGETFVLSTYAHTPGKAKQNLFFQMSKKVDKNIKAINAYYADHSGGYEIKEG